MEISVQQYALSCLYCAIADFGLTTINLVIPMPHYFEHAGLYFNFQGVIQIDTKGH